MSATAGCLRDIMETDIMDYMHVDHPYNEKEIWKMKHATPARIGIGHCGPRYTTEAELRFLASHAAANDAVYNEVPEETVKKLGVFEVQTKCANKNGVPTVIPLSSSPILIVGKRSGIFASMDGEQRPSPK